MHVHDARPRVARGGLDTGNDSRPSPVADLLRKRRFVKRSACGLKRSVSVKRTTLDKSIGRLSFGLSDGGSSSPCSSHTDVPASRLARQRWRARRISEIMLRGISVGGAPEKLAITSRVIGRAISSGAGSLTTSTLHCKRALATRSKAVRTPRTRRGRLAVAALRESTPSDALEQYYMLRIFWCPLQR